MATRKRFERPITDHDIRNICATLHKDFPEWDISWSITWDTNNWMTVTARAVGKAPDGTEHQVTTRVYNTPKTPSLLQSQWKALEALHWQIQRAVDGLPALIGF